jgi:hypothetical protein
MNTTIRNILLILFPGALSIYRHSNKLTVVDNAAPVLFIELAPFVALSIIQSSSLTMAILSYFLLCIFYEIGYALNDSVTTQSNEIKTYRPTVDLRYIYAFILFRIALIALVLIVSFFFWRDYFAHYLIYSAILSSVFIAHNRSIGANKKIFTFVTLNTLKLAFRILNVGNVPIFLLAASPYIFLKLIHYLNHKKAVLFGDLQFGDLVYPIYASFFVLIAFVDINYVIITFIYLVNHKKSEWVKLKNDSP